MLHLILVHPQIPQNTGNIIRLCANTGAALHLIEPLGFIFNDKKMQRAGLDYHEYADVKRYPSFSAFLEAKICPPEHLFAFSTTGKTCFSNVSFPPQSGLVFGSETAGLPPLLKAFFPPTHLLRLPMREKSRSLNLSNAAAIALYEALRQNNFTF